MQGILINYANCRICSAAGVYHHQTHSGKSFRSCLINRPESQGGHVGDFHALGIPVHEAGEGPRCCNVCFESLNIFAELTLASSEETWVLTESTSTWAGTTAADRAWRFLRRTLDMYDNAKTDYAYSKIVYEILVSNQDQRPPAWLVTSLQVSPRILAQPSFPCVPCLCE
jgi:hypothetical protein